MIDLIDSGLNQKTKQNRGKAKITFPIPQGKWYMGGRALPLARLLKQLKQKQSLITKERNMKQLIKFRLPFIISTFMLLLVQLSLFAQDSGGSTGGSESGSATTRTTTTTTSTDWYTSPWVWVAGAAVFILLLVALLRGRDSGTTTTAGRTDRVTVTKRTETDL
jgi:hypothetical protein